MGGDFKIADITLADWGRKEITMAESEHGDRSWQGSREQQELDARPP